MTEATAEICNQCGRSVKPGSGWFVNRVPSDFGSAEEARDDHGAPYPEGAWQCSECANDTDILGGLGHFQRYGIIDTLQGHLGRIPTPEETDACIDYVVEDRDYLAEKFREILDDRIAAWARERKPQGQ